MKKILTVLLLSGSLLQAFDDTESMIDSRRTIQERAEQAQTDFKHLTVHTFSTRNLDKMKQAVDEGALAFTKKLQRYNLSNFLASLVIDSKDTNKEFIEAIIRKGADVKMKDYSSRITILHVVKSPCLAQVLINNGANVHATNRNGETPLHRASSFDVAQVFINNGANIHAKDMHGHTPLHSTLSPEIAQLLIDNGANVNAKDEWGYTPLHRTPYFDFDLLQVFINNGANIHAKDMHGHTPLHSTPSPKTAQLLIENGANVNAKDEWGNTPLHLAGCCPKKAQLLLDNGANVNVKNKRGETPLDIARGNPEFTRLLLKHGAHYRTSLWSRWCAAIGAWFSK